MYSTPGNRVPLQARLSRTVNPVSYPTLTVGRNVLARAEVNVDDTPGVATLLDRDYKTIEVDENAFVTTTEIKPENQSAASASSRSKTASPSMKATPPGGPQRSKEAIDQGLQQFADAKYLEAIQSFQLALELPGNGFMRLAGSPKEFACASEGEENAALYNMACCYCRLGQPPAAITCIEALLDNGFTDYDALTSDPDLAGLPHEELSQLISKHNGLMAKLFRGRKEDASKKRPWLQW